MAHINREFANSRRAWPSPFLRPPFRASDFRRRDHGARGPGRQGHRLSVDNTQKFLAEARKRPEVARVTTTFIPTVPQVFVDVDRDKVLKQGWF